MGTRQLVSCGMQRSSMAALQWQVSWAIAYMRTVSVGLSHCQRLCPTILHSRASLHHMSGGNPGQFPAFNTFGVTNPFTPLPLFDPFGFTADLSEEEKATKRLREVQNGRLAMIGLFSLISEARVPGAVPALAGYIKPYDGEVMGPFSAADAG